MPTKPYEITVLADIEPGLGRPPKRSPVIVSSAAGWQHCGRLTVAKCRERRVVESWPELHTEGRVLTMEDA